ncbi:uncharacterized protein LOC143299087 [Babylonia areolata]|uniref:uncharacterized protein LOC143299087 n=1 Tax=Babylonia areolata TaxID=304850 RepID=UPI003FD246DB
MAVCFGIRVTWLPLFLACVYVLCVENAGDSVFSKTQQTYSYRSSYSQPKKSELTEPGVIVGIIVGVLGVLVVVGVSILLCRIFCCKQSSCCSCCKGEGQYLEAGAVPIKIPTQESTPPDNQPISTVSQTRPTHGHPRPPKADRQARDTFPIPPRYDDIPELDWKLQDVAKNKKLLEPDVVRGSQNSLDRARLAENSIFFPDGDDDDDEVPNGLPVSGTKRNEKTPTRRKLTYEADSPADSSSHTDGGRPKKRNADATRHGKEFPPARHKHRKRHPKPPEENDGRAAATESNPNETGDGREFPLLELEPRSRGAFSPSYPDSTSRAWGEVGAGEDDRHFRPVELDHQPRAFHQHRYQDSRSTMWGGEGRPLEEHRQEEGRPWEDHRQEEGRPWEDHRQEEGRPWEDHRQEERRPWEEHRQEERRPRHEHRQIPTPRAPMPSNRSDNSSVHVTAGHVNAGFNQDTTETEV